MNIDACYERIRDDLGMFLRHCLTKYQLADILTKGSFTKLEWDIFVDLLQIRPAKRTKQEKDAQAKIFQVESMFDDFENIVADAASIPKTKPNHKNHKNKKRGKQVRAQEVGGCNSY